MRTQSVALVLLALGTALACGPPGTTLGGFCPIDANAPLVQEMAQFAVSTHASRTNAVNDGSISVDHAWSQVVSGFNYKMTITTRFNGQTNECHFVVYDQSWTNTRELTNDECHVIHHNRHAIREGHELLLKALYN